MALQRINQIFGNDWMNMSKSDIANRALSDFGVNLSPEQAGQLYGGQQIDWNPTINPMLSKPVSTGGDYYGNPPAAAGKLIPGSTTNTTTNTAAATSTGGDYYGNQSKPPVIPSSTGGDYYGNQSKPPLVPSLVGNTHFNDPLGATSNGAGSGNTSWVTGNNNNTSDTSATSPVEVNNTTVGANPAGASGYNPLFATNPVTSATPTEFGLGDNLAANQTNDTGLNILGQQTDVNPITTGGVDQNAGTREGGWGMFRHVPGATSFLTDLLKLTSTYGIDKSIFPESWWGGGDGDGGGGGGAGGGGGSGGGSSGVFPDERFTMQGPAGASPTDYYNMPSLVPRIFSNEGGNDMGDEALTDESGLFPISPQPGPPGEWVPPNITVEGGLNPTDLSDWWGQMGVNPRLGGIETNVGAMGDEIGDMRGDFSQYLQDMNRGFNAGVRGRTDLSNAMFGDRGFAGVGDSFADLNRNLGNRFGNVERDIGNLYGTRGFGGVTDLLNQGIGGMNQGFRDMNTGFTDMGNRVDRQWTEKMLPEFQRLFTGQEANQGLINTLTGNVGDLGTSLGNRFGDLESMLWGDQFMGGTDPGAFGALGNRVGEQVAGQGDRLESFFKTGMEGLGSQMTGLGNQFTGFGAGQDRIQDLLFGNQFAGGDRAGAFDRLGDRFNTGLGALGDTFGNQFGDLEKAMFGLGGFGGMESRLGGMGTNIADLVSGQQGIGEDFGDVSSRFGDINARLDSFFDQAMDGGPEWLNDPMALYEMMGPRMREEFRTMLPGEEDLMPDWMQGGEQAFLDRIIPKLFPDGQNLEGILGKVLADPLAGLQADMEALKSGGLLKELYKLEDVSDLSATGTGEAAKDFSMEGGTFYGDPPDLSMPAITDYGQALQMPLYNDLLSSMGAANPFDTRRDDIIGGQEKRLDKIYDEKRENLENRFAVMDNLGSPGFREAMKDLEEERAQAKLGVTSAFGQEAARIDESMRRGRAQDLASALGFETGRVRDEMGFQDQLQRQATEDYGNYLDQIFRSYMAPQDSYDNALRMMLGGLGTAIQPNIGAAMTGLGGQRGAIGTYQDKMDQNMRNYQMMTNPGAFEGM